jgi:pullulanase/glycogen debranching enzyme
MKCNTVFAGTLYWVVCIAIVYISLPLERLLTGLKFTSKSPLLLITWSWHQYDYYRGFTASNNTLNDSITDCHRGFTAWNNTLNDSVTNCHKGFTALNNTLNDSVTDCHRGFTATNNTLNDSVTDCHRGFTALNLCSGKYMACLYCNIS